MKKNSNGVVYFMDLEDHLISVVSDAIYHQVKSDTWAQVDTAFWANGADLVSDLQSDIRAAMDHMIHIGILQD